MRGWAKNENNINNKLSSKSLVFISRLLGKCTNLKELSLHLNDWNIRNLRGGDL